MIRIDELKDHKDVLFMMLENVQRSINKVVEGAEKIRNQSYSAFCKEHSDVLDLLDKHKKENESCYECLERLLHLPQDRGKK